MEMSKDGGCEKYLPDPNAVPGEPTEDDAYEEMTIDEIMNGKPDGTFPGLIPLMQRYVDAQCPEPHLKQVIDKYLELISLRSSGKLMTTAAWIRKFVQTHPAYKHDSIVTEEIAYDLIDATVKIATGEMKCPELLGDLV